MPTGIYILAFFTGNRQTITVVLWRQILTACRRAGTDRTGISIYPNPAKSIVQVNFSRQADNATLKLHSANSQKCGL